MLQNLFNKIFKYEEKEDYEFHLPTSSNNIDESFFEKLDTEIVSDSLETNLNYLKVKYNMYCAGSGIYLNSLHLAVHCITAAAGCRHCIIFTGNCHFQRTDRPDAGYTVQRRIRSLRPVRR